MLHQKIAWRVSLGVPDLPAMRKKLREAERWNMKQRMNLPEGWMKLKLKFRLGKPKLQNLHLM